MIYVKALALVLNVPGAWLPKHQCEVNNCVLCEASAYT